MQKTLPREKILTPNFILSCSASFGSFTSFNLMLASLPILILALGGQQSDVGLTMGIFAISALAVRPISGRAADQWGRKGVMVGGTVLLIVSSLLSSMVESVPMLIALRGLQGMGWGIFSTASAALIADIAPPSRRGEAMGYFGVFASVAMAIGPALGVYVAKSYGFAAMFLLSAAFGALAAGSSSAIAEPRPRLQASAGKLTLATTVHRKSLFPATIIFCNSVPYASVMTFVPVFAEAQGMTNPGMFFTVYAIALITFRAPIGRLSDIFGRTTVIAPGLVAGVVSLVVLSQASSMPPFLFVAFLYGLHFGAVQPMLMAMTVDRVAPGERGAAMGTFILAMDLGIGIGSFLWGYVIHAVGFGTTYVIAAALTSVALAILLIGHRR